MILTFWKFTSQYSKFMWIFQEFHNFLQFLFSFFNLHIKYIS